MCFEHSTAFNVSDVAEMPTTETRAKQIPGEPCGVLGVRANADGEVFMVSVCSNCLPGETIFKQWEHLKGFVQLSHGICKFHSDQFLAKLKTERLSAARRQAAEPTNKPAQRKTKEKLWQKTLKKQLAQTPQHR